MFIKIKLLPLDQPQPLLYLENLILSNSCQDNIHINTDHIIYAREHEYNGTKYCVLCFTNGMMKACLYSDIAGYLKIYESDYIDTGDYFDLSDIETENSISNTKFDKIYGIKSDVNEIIDSFRMTYNIGYTKSEINRMCDRFNIDSEKIHKNLLNKTMQVIDNENVFYHHDVKREILKVLTSKQ